MIYFKQVVHDDDIVPSRIYQGILHTCSMIDPESIFWALDELGFDPYRFILSEPSHGINVSWLGTDSAIIKTTAYDPEDHEDDSDFDLSYEDRWSNQNHDFKEWFKISRKVSGLILVKCDINGNTI